MSDGGKGSTPRPLSVDPETFANNWDNIFKKEKTEDDPFGEPPAGGMTTQQGESLGS